jgi:hypothetical protein
VLKFLEHKGLQQELHPSAAQQELLIEVIIYRKNRIGYKPLLIRVMLYNTKQTSLSNN